jgi:hypothetical protein
MIVLLMQEGSETGVEEKEGLHSENSVVGQLQKERQINVESKNAGLLKI